MRLLVILACAMVLAALTVGSTKAEELALWLFDEGKGDVAEDSTGNGNDGKIVNAKYVQGKYGTALEFGGDAFVNIGLPDSLQNGIDQAFTAEVWVKANEKPPAGESTLIFMQAGGPIALGFTTSTGGGLYGYAGTSSKITDPKNADGVPIGEWFHFAETYDGKTQKLYFNGEEIATKDIVGAVTHTQNAWTIGAWSTQDQNFLQGVTLDEMRISNEALPPEELGFFSRFSAVEPAEKLTTTWAGVKGSSL